MANSRAHVSVVLAMSADGKIADRDRAAARFSSPADLSHLEQLVAQADAVLFGAGTLRAYGTCLSVRQLDLLAQRQARQQPPQPIQIVCSHTGKIDSQLRFFRQLVPRWLLTSSSGAVAWSDSSPNADHYFERILPDLRKPMPWPSVLQNLPKLGIHRLAVLGGGTLVAGLAEQNLIDELHLTVCPLLLGGTTAPTPFDGLGLSNDQALKLELAGVHTINDEVFLHYRRCHLQRD